MELATVELTSGMPDTGMLSSLMAVGDRLAELRSESMHLKTWDLTARQVGDIELMLNGGFSPLEGFLNRADYESVLDDMRLANGSVWPVPVTLDVTEAFSDGLAGGDRVALLHPEGMVLAVLTVGDVWRPDRLREAEKLFGEANEEHPGVFALLHHTDPVYIGGNIEGLELPVNHSFDDLRHTPAQLREQFASRGIDRVAAFHTTQPMHRSDVEFTKRGAAHVGAHLLIQPAIGATEPGDFDGFMRTRCYRAALKQYEPGSATLSLLPLAVRTCGLRETVFNAVVAKNYGADSLIVCNDHVGPETGLNGSTSSDRVADRVKLSTYAEEIGIELISLDDMVYDSDAGAYVPAQEVPAGHTVYSLPAAELYGRLTAEEEIPEWFSYPEVISELRKAHPPRNYQGLTLFFTGLPSSGKSTIANAVLLKLMEIGTRPVTLLDGDLVRKHLSSELGFSKEHRDLNIQRIGYVASEITKNRGVAICAPIAPYAKVRRLVREMISREGGFIEIHIATPLEVCEMRDRKGLYAKARAGLIKGFTGIDDPYEIPVRPELRIDTSNRPVDEAASIVVDYLRSEGYV